MIVWQEELLESHHWDAAEPQVGVNDPLTELLAINAETLEQVHGDAWLVQAAAALGHPVQPRVSLDRHGPHLGIRQLLGGRLQVAPAQVI